MADKRQMRLGASIRGLGYNISAWLHPDVDPSGSEKVQHFATAARIAEEAMFDTVFLADTLAVRSYDDPKGAAARSSNNVELEPITLLAALAMCTKHIGLVATASTSYNEPYHIARKFASIDHISGGRAGWNAVTSWSQQEANNFSREYHFDKDERYERATEFLQVVLGLWNSWDADAFLHDKKRGLFYDESKMHVLNYRGTFFNVRGPLGASRTPQGRPVIFQAGASEHGLNLAGAFADVVYSVPQDMAEAIRGRQVLRAHAEKFGRQADDIKSLPGVQIIVGRSSSEARDKLEYLKTLIDPLQSLASIKRMFGNLLGNDISLDDRVPEVGNTEGKFSTATNTVRRARENGWTVRRLCQEFGMGQQVNLSGTPDEIVSTLVDWFEADACDGFNILPAYLPGNLAEVAEHIVPRLQDRGLFRRRYEGATLRENLGLPRV
ncbi:FMN-dependent oxidoreductase (nitrilotriacetate monooxygenase family) [Bradyrhizobium sp. LB7.1]